MDIWLWLTNFALILSPESDNDHYYAHFRQNRVLKLLLHQFDSQSDPSQSKIKNGPLFVMSSGQALLWYSYKKCYQKAFISLKKKIICQPNI